MEIWAESMSEQVPGGSRFTDPCGRSAREPSESESETSQLPVDRLSDTWVASIGGPIYSRSLLEG